MKTQGFGDPSAPEDEKNKVKTLEPQGPLGAKNNGNTYGFGAPGPPRSQNTCENIRFRSPQGPQGARTLVKTQGFKALRSTEEPEYL